MTSFDPGQQADLDVECNVSALVHVAFRGSLEGLDLTNGRDDHYNRLLLYILITGTIWWWLDSLIAMGKNKFYVWTYFLNIDNSHL